MATALDRRLQKLEAAANASADDKELRVVFVRVGQDRDAEIAKQVGELRPHDLVVQFVRAVDQQSPRTLQ